MAPSTLAGWLFFGLLLLSFPGGIIGLITIWRNGEFALAGRIIFSLVIAFGLCFLVRLLTFPVPCQSGPCG